jgi:DNA-directed RNA polymerase specialized sigma24 family protein
MARDVRHKGQRPDARRRAGPKCLRVHGGARCAVCARPPTASCTDWRRRGYATGAQYGARDTTCLVHESYLRFVCTGNRTPLTLPTALGVQLPDAEQTVPAAHEGLEQAEPRLAQVAQMRYFGDYSEQEIAETLEVTQRTVQRDWDKAWLILAAALR